MFGHKFDLRLPDKSVSILGLSLILIGAIAVSSSSIEYAAKYFGSPWHYTLRHVFYIIFSLSIGFFVYIIPVRFWFDTSVFWLLVAIALLMFVLIPGVGREINGSQRWLPLGVISFQPSEFAKFAIITFLSGYLVRHNESISRDWFSFLKPVLVTLAMAVLLLMEPDFGAAVIVIGTVSTMLFLAGVRLIHFFCVAAVAAGALTILAVSAPYRVQRLVAYVDPWSDPYANGYQLVQSLIAFGRGDWFGVGLGNSIQKLFYLPEAHTDFIFAIWAEESGAIGALLVMLIYAGLVARIIWIGWQSGQVSNFFGAHFCNGFAILIFGQAVINIGVTMGLLPTKGMTLPLISWGGTSLLVTVVMLSIVLRIEQDIKSRRKSID